MRIKLRQYYCPLCGRIEEHSTNYTGEIYTPCQDCGHSALYCVERRASLTGKGDAEAVLHVYRCSIDDPIQAGTYKTLCAVLGKGGMGYKKFAAIDDGGRTKKYFSTMRAWEAHDGEVLQLFNPSQFEGQYVSNLGRVHDWNEAVYPNRKVKHGYWLERVRKESV